MPAAEPADPEGGHDLRRAGCGGGHGGGAVLAQTPPVRPSTDIAPGTRAESVMPLVQGQVARAPAASLRGLDKVSGQSTDLPLLVGDSVVFGRLEVRLGNAAIRPPIPTRTLSRS